jgi:multiple sugar transport system permease protein
VYIFAFVWQFGDNFYSGILFPRKWLMHVPLASVFTQFSTDHNQDFIGAHMTVFASIVLVIAPILIIYIILQRQFIESIERSGIVG